MPSFSIIYKINGGLPFSMKTIPNFSCYLIVEKHLHIISAGIPDPASSDLEQDLFQAILQFHQLGIKIHLHCFEDGKKQSNTLPHYCQSVHYYPRNLGHQGISHILPFMVSSRNHERLKQNLLKDHYPIYFQGIAASGLLLDPIIKNRSCFLRILQDESILYQSIAKSSSHFAKKIFYYFESWLLKRFQKSIAKNATKIGLEIPFLIPNWEPSKLSEMGSYCLFHGNLGNEEESIMATWLLKEVFSDLKIPLVLAGSYPSPALRELAHEQSHTCLVANPSPREMKDLMEKAHIHIIPTLTPGGNQYALLCSLFFGRHCITNEAAIAGTNLAPGCYLGREARSFQSLIKALYSLPFQENNILLRKQFIDDLLKNRNGAEKILAVIFAKE